jgi:hypothetical protein
MYTQRGERRMTKSYKIRNKETGQFSRGGAYNYDIWTKGGKTWSNIGHVKSHLKQFMDGDVLMKKYPYHNAEIVEIVINYEECEKYDVDGFIEGLKK